MQFPLNLRILSNISQGLYHPILTKLNHNLFVHNIVLYFLSIDSNLHMLFLQIHNCTSSISQYLSMRNLLMMGKNIQFRIIDIQNRQHYQSYYRQKFLYKNSNQHHKMQQQIQTRTQFHYTYDNTHYHKCHTLQNQVFHHSGFQNINNALAYLKFHISLNSTLFPVDRKNNSQQLCHMLHSWLTQNRFLFRHKHCGPTGILLKTLADISKQKSTSYRKYQILKLNYKISTF